MTDVSSTTVTGAEAATSTPNVTLTPFFSGIALDVTAADQQQQHEVILHVRPAVTGRRRSPQGDHDRRTTDLSLPLAFSTVRARPTASCARRAWRIIVIGGLIAGDELRRRGPHARLRRSLGIGKLFSHQRQATRRRRSS